MSKREIAIAVKPDTHEYVLLMGGKRCVQSGVLPAEYKTLGHTHPHKDLGSVRANAFHPSGGDIVSFLAGENEAEFVLTDMGVFFYRKMRQDVRLADLADAPSPNSIATYANIMCISMAEDYKNAKRFAEMVFGIDMEFVPFTEEGREYRDSSSDALLVNMIKVGFYGYSGTRLHDEINTHLLEFYGSTAIESVIQKYGLGGFISGEHFTTVSEQLAHIGRSSLGWFDQTLTRLFFDREWAKDDYRQVLLDRYSERLQQRRAQLQGGVSQSEEVRKLHAEYLDNLLEAQLVVMDLLEMRRILQSEKFIRADLFASEVIGTYGMATGHSFLQNDLFVETRLYRIVKPYLLSQQKADRFFREADSARLGEMTFADIAQAIDKYPLDKQGLSDMRALYLAKWVHLDAEGRETSDPIKHDLHRRLFDEGASAEILAEHGDNPSPKSRLYVAMAHLYEGRFEEAKAEVKRGLETMLRETLDDEALISELRDPKSELQFLADPGPT